jgi:hypothetical protein
MGLIKKTIAGSLAVASGGLSLGVVQFRSDTERVAHQTKLLRREQEWANEIALQGLAEAQKHNALIQKEIAQAKTASSQPTGIAEVPGHSVAPLTTTSTPLSIAGALTSLHRLHSRGLLSADEYSSKKSDLLQDLFSQSTSKQLQVETSDQPSKADQLAFDAVEKMRSSYRNIKI